MKKELKKQVDELKKVIEETTDTKAICLEAKQIGTSLHTEWVIRDEVNTRAHIRMTETGIYEVLFVEAAALKQLVKLNARLKELND